MEKDNKIKIFLVDDDVLYLKLLEIELQQQGGFAIETYLTGELCVEHLSRNPSVIILDYHLDGINKNAMNGIETLDKIKEVKPAMNVVILSSQDNIDVAIECMHHNAFDYVVKSETAFIRLKKVIATVLLHQKMEKELSWYMDKL